MPASRVCEPDAGPDLLRAIEGQGRTSTYALLGARSALSEKPKSGCQPGGILITGLPAVRRSFHLSYVGLLSLSAPPMLGVAGSAWQAVRATQAEAVAVAERDEKEQARQAEAEQRDAAVLSEQVAQQERDKAQQQRDEAQQQRDEVRALNDRFQRTLYAADMNLARHACPSVGADPTHPATAAAEKLSFLRCDFFSCGHRHRPLHDPHHGPVLCPH